MVSRTAWTRVSARMESTHKHIFLALCTVAWAFTGCGSWPDGLYGLPMPKSGCPVAETFNWSTGSRTQQTEKGSRGSDPVHLAGVYSYETDQITQNFCMKTTPFRGGQYVWQKGRYCIYKANGHSCPVGFNDGYIYWDDAAPHIGHSLQATSGILPEGIYERNTQIYFCCRNDAMPFKEVELPTASPFYLIKWGDRCQEVRGMDVTEEWVKWRDEKWVNWNSFGGLYPKVQHSKYPIVYTKLYYCYYQTEPENNTLKTILMVVYVIAGIAGLIIFLLVLACVLQRIFSRKPKEYEENNLANAARENSGHAEAARSEPIVAYQPVPSSDKFSNVEDGTVSITKRPLPVLGGASNAPGPSVAPIGGSAELSATGGTSPGDTSPMVAPEYYERDPRPPSFPPSYEEVLRADGKL